jgi:predicted ATP-grasp superfamily ATP-dependent carboligase
VENGDRFEEKPVLFPTNDQWTVTIARYKTRLEKWYRPCVADDNVVELLINKAQFYKWGMEHDYPVPKIYSPEDLERSDSRLFPIIAKPNARRIPDLCANNANLGSFLDTHRMTILRDFNEYKDFLARYCEYIDFFLFQEYVAGMADQMYTIGIYANREHEILGLFSGRKVRGFPPDIGDCIVGQGERMPEEIISCVKEIVRKLKYSGIAEFEFKKDSLTGELRLIEINPRSWSWIGITPACGVSLPWIAYSDMTGIEHVAFKRSNVEDGRVIYLKLISDLQNCLFSYKKMGYPQLHKSPFEWMREMRGKEKIFAEFSRDDPLVSLHALASHVKSHIKSLTDNAKGSPTHHNIESPIKCPKDNIEP